jgi:hypothetical protein
MPRTPVDEVQRARAKQLRRAMTDVMKNLEGVVLSIHQAAEQAAPPSLTLPRKGGGDGEFAVPHDKFPAPHDKEGEVTPC